MTIEENLPQANILFYTVKLLTGEELLCTLVDENEQTLTIENPIIVKSLDYIDQNGKLTAELSCHIWLPFCMERIFPIQTNHILYYGPMHIDSHNFYIRLVNKFNTINSTEIKQSTNSFIIEQPELIQ